jgi:urease accessory protein
LNKPSGGVDVTDQWIDALHLASPLLPIGGFAYSQGLEQAQASGWVTDRDSAQVWIRDALLLVLAQQELPAWLACFRATWRSDWATVIALAEQWAALRETAELRLESRQMAYSMVRLFEQWVVPERMPPTGVMQRIVANHTIAHATMCGLRFNDETIALSAFIWAWLENQVLSAVKIVPLGQLDGQVLLHALKPAVGQAIATALVTDISAAGSAPIGLAMISSQHETQYTRLFRS